MSETPSNPTTEVSESDVELSESELLERFKEKFDVILGSVDIRVIHAISMAQTDPECTFARNNRVYVFMNAKDLARRASSEERAFWRSVNILIDAGFLEVERADFVFNGNRNCYALCYPFLHQWLKNPHYATRVARADASWRMPQVAERNASTGLDLVPYYKKKPGRFAKRKGVQNHSRKQQRANFINNIQKGTSVPFIRKNGKRKLREKGEGSSESSSGDASKGADSVGSSTFSRNLFFKITPTELYLKKLYYNLLKENSREEFKQNTLKYEKSYEQLSGDEIYILSTYWLTCFKAAGGRVRFNKPPTLLARYLGQLFKKGIICSRKELEEHAKCVGGKFKWTRDNIKDALSFKAAALFKRGCPVTITNEMKLSEEELAWEKEVQGVMCGMENYTTPPLPVQEEYMTHEEADELWVAYQEKLQLERIEAYRARKEAEKREAINAGHRHMFEAADRQIAEMKKFEDMDRSELLSNDDWEILKNLIRQPDMEIPPHPTPPDDSAEVVPSITGEIVPSKDDSADDSTANALDLSIHESTCVNNLDLKPCVDYDETIGSIQHKDHDVWQEKKLNISPPKSFKSIGMCCEHIFKTLPVSPMIRNESDCSYLMPSVPPFTTTCLTTPYLKK